MSSWDGEYDEDVGDGSNETNGIVAPTTTIIDDEPDFCPLCQEELDLTDLAFRPCMVCEYQICLWCYHQMLEQPDPKCPACRSPFDPNNGPTVAPDNIQRAAQHLATQQQTQQKAAMKKKSSNAYKLHGTIAPGPSSKDLSNQMVMIEGAGMTPLSEVRVVQRNLCIAAGTQINLSSGVSMPIETLAAMPSVLSYDEHRKGLCSRPVAAFLSQGVKSCVELRFNDGRRLTCTRDHRLLTPDGSWCEAATLKVGQDYVAVGTEQPPVSSPAQPFTLTVGDIQLPMDQALAFTRILGYARHTVSQHQDQQQLTLQFSCEQDALACQTDVASILAPEVPPPEVQSVSPGGFSLTLPSSLTTAIQSMHSSSTIPPFLLDESCPLELVREFIAAVFGTTAQASELQQNGEFGPVSFPVADASESDALSSLLRRCNVESGFDSALRTLLVTDLGAFATHIGFRYAGWKQLKLAVAVVAQRMVAQKEAQNVKEAVEIMQASSILQSSNSTSPVLPLFRVKLTSCTEVGERAVYDLSVPSAKHLLAASPSNEGSFVAAGVIVHNCYVVGLSSACGREDLLRKREWFGGFGRAMKVAVAKSFGIGSSQATFAAYVTYQEKQDAAKAIRAVNFEALGVLLAKGGSGAGGHADGEPPRARASFGTTKYCAAWLKGHPCTKSNCLYLHHLAPLTDCCTKDQLQRDRFDERFGVGNKKTLVPAGSSSSSTGAAPPAGEMLRAVSQPTPSTIAPVATKAPLSFASVTAQALGASGQGAGLNASPPPSEEEFPPLSSSTGPPSSVDSRSKTPLAAIVAAAGGISREASPNKAQMQQQLDEAETEYYEEQQPEDQQEQEEQPDEEAVDEVEPEDLPIDDTAEVATDETEPHVDDFQSNLAAPHGLNTLAPDPDSVFATHIPLPTLALDPAKALEAIFARAPIASLPQVSNAAKPIRPPPGFGAKPAIGAPRAPPPGFGGGGVGVGVSAPSLGTVPAGPAGLNGLGGLGLGEQSVRSSSSTNGGFGDFTSWASQPPLGVGGLLTPDSRVGNAPAQSQSLWGNTPFGASDRDSVAPSSQQQLGSSQLHSYSDWNTPGVGLGIGGGNNDHLSDRDLTSSINGLSLNGIGGHHQQQQHQQQQPPHGGFGGVGGIGGSDRGYGGNNSNPAQLFQQHALFQQSQQGHLQTPPGMVSRIPAPSTNGFNQDPWMQPSQQQQQHDVLGGGFGSQHSGSGGNSGNGSQNTTPQDSPMKARGGGRSRYEFAEDVHAHGQQQQLHPHQQQQPHGLGQLHSQQQQLQLHEQERQQLQQLQRAEQLAQHFRGGAPINLLQQLQHQQQQHQAPDDLPWHEQDDGSSLNAFGGGRFAAQHQQQHVQQQHPGHSMQQQQQQSHYSQYDQRPQQQQQPPSALHAHHSAPFGSQRDDSYLRIMNAAAPQGQSGGFGSQGLHQQQQQQHQLAPSASVRNDPPRGLQPPMPHRRPPLGMQPPQQPLHQFHQQQQQSSFLNARNSFSAVTGKEVEEESLHDTQHDHVHHDIVERLWQDEHDENEIQEVVKIQTPREETTNNNNNTIMQQQQTTTTSPSTWNKPETIQSTPTQEIAIAISQPETQPVPVPPAAIIAPSETHASIPPPSPAKAVISNSRMVIKRTKESPAPRASLPKVAPAPTAEKERSVTPPPPPPPPPTATKQVATPPRARNAREKVFVAAAPPVPQAAVPAVPVPVVAVPAPIITPPIQTPAPAAAQTNATTRVSKKERQSKPVAAKVEPTQLEATKVVQPKPIAPIVVAPSVPAHTSVPSSTPSPSLLPPRIVKKGTAAAIQATATSARASPEPSASPSPKADPKQSPKRGSGASKSSTVIETLPVPVPSVSLSTATTASSTPVPSPRSVASSSTTPSTNTSAVNTPRAEKGAKGKGKKAAKAQAVTAALASEQSQQVAPAAEKPQEESKMPEPVPVFIGAKEPKRPPKRPAKSFPAASGVGSSVPTKAGYVISTSHVSLPPTAPVFLAPHVSPAAIAAAWAHHVPPSELALAATGPGTLVTPAPVLTEVWLELMHLARLVRSGSLARAELQDVLDSIAEWSEVPRTVEELLSKVDAQDAAKSKEQEERKQPDGPEKHDAESKAADGPSVASTTQAKKSFTHPHLLELRFDAPLSAYYDRSYREYEKSTPFSQSLCREIYVLQRQLDAQKFHERAVKDSLDQARNQLERTLMGDELEDDGDATFPDAEEDDDHQHDSHNEKSTPSPAQEVA